MARYTNRDVPNYLPQAILATLFCCQVPGIVAICYAAQANSLSEVRQYGAAQNAAERAWTWIMVSVGLMAVLGVVALVAGLADASP